jgi:tRNA threonylcarbamoyladenosine biosynthesis protein TsaB
MKISTSILAFDCSAAACSAAVWIGGTVRAHRQRPMARGHAEVLMPIILDVLAESDVRFPDLDAIAVTVGPGSFTGLRIGLSVARGIALAISKPIIGVTTFAVVAESIPAGERTGRSILVLLDSKRAELYCQAFAEDLRPQGLPRMLAPEDLQQALPAGRILLAGDGVPAARAFLPGDGADITVSSILTPPDAAFIGPLAHRLAGSGDGLPPTPLYLREADVTMPGAPSKHAMDVADRGALK